MPKIFDNIENQLIKGLNETLLYSARADFCVGYFYLSGWKQVAERIENLPGAVVAEKKDDFHRYCRLLVGMNKMPLDIIREHFAKRADDVDMEQGEANELKKKLAQQFKEQLTIGTPSDEDEKTLQTLSRQLKDKKVVVKLHLRHALHAKLYLCFQKERNRIEGFVGSSNLTLSGLVKQGELNVDVLEQDAAVKLSQWFDDRWDDKWCFDISQELIQVIDNSWASEKLLSPYHIYLKIAYHLSQEARAGLHEYQLPSIFQRELFDFQQAAVKIAAKKLEKRNGVLIGDVVGLGKTITACAIAKMFEESSFYSTLIICPPNLITMWDGYINKYDLKANVISSGSVQGKLANLRRYKLVIIDESHNFRNDQGNRYKAIKQYLSDNDSKVILLSATPYNKSYLDLSNQLKLFIPDEQDLGISPEQYIAQIGGAAFFTANHSDTLIRSIKAFEWSNYSDDWRQLMRLYLVRRTRSFIKNNYAHTDPDDGRKYLTFPDGTKSYFPDRIPKRVEYTFDYNDPTDQYAKLYSEEIVTILNNLQLPRYGLGNYYDENSTLKLIRDEAQIIKNLSRAGKRLMGFCRTNLFKRLESSGYSFLLSLSRHILRNYIFIYAFEKNLPLPIGKSISNNLDDFLEDDDTDGDGDGGGDSLNLILTAEQYRQQAEKVYKIYAGNDYKHRFEWIRCEVFDDFRKTITQKSGAKKTITMSLISDLKNDAAEILKVLTIGAGWNSRDDRQLNALQKLCTQTHSQEKVLVFTQFADTAEYLAENLKARGVTKLECVTGAHKNPTAMAERFSPISNDKPHINQMNHDLRILIATDVLSEGQNLQDAHIIVNYDLPWAIIRLIQRAGRVDRIGQTAPTILCYSFLPEEGIENIINLRGRLRHRISENAEVVGSDETFFDGDPVNIADLYNEKSGILDESEQETETDLTSYAYQIWKNAIDANPSLKKRIENMPNVVYATKNTDELSAKNGVIVYARTQQENDVLTWIDSDGKMVTQSQHTILKTAECSADTQPKEKLPNHHELVKKAVDFIRDEEKNSGGAIGKKTGVRYRTYMRLKNYCAEQDGTFFITEPLKKAVEDIFLFPMKEFAKDVINRQMKSGINDDELAELVVSLREEGKLCMVNNDEQFNKEPHIICSLGLIHL